MKERVPTEQQPPGQVFVLFEEIARINPMQRDFVETNFAALSSEEKQLFEKYVDYSLACGISISEQATAYDVIVKDTFREQVYFKRHGHYRYSSYDEVAHSVYQNNEYMTNYMVGLAISGYLWANHVELHRFFLTALETGAEGEYLEIGPGHGFYFMQAMKNGLFSQCTGVDISPTSVAMTHQLLSSRKFGNFKNFKLVQADFFSWESTVVYDFIVMAEVLEHVENPQDFLVKISDLLSNDGRVYITTCINAPAIDHIFLYSSVEQLTDQVSSAGLKVVDELVVPYSGKTVEESLALKLPINIAQVLTKA